MRHDLQAICTVCRTAIADGAGHIAVDRHEAAKRRADQAGERQDSRGGGKSAGRSAAELADEFLARLQGPPPVALWVTAHYPCSDTTVDTYGIPVERIRTYRSLVTWTAHLLEKPWFVGTNWNAVLRAAAGTSGTGQVGLVPAWR